MRTVRGSAMERSAAVAQRGETEGNALDDDLSPVATDVSMAAKERYNLRVALRRMNDATWCTGASRPVAQLDSSLKRNSSLIKKLKQGAIAEHKESLLREISALNLEKYLDEVLQAISEMLLKSATLKDRLACAEVRNTGYAS